MTSHHDLMVCTDCIMLLANGEFADGMTEDRKAEIVKGVNDWADEGYYLVASDGHDVFSHAWCDVCNTHLGGERHGAAALPLRSYA